jgi:hypothetical protein
MPLCKTDDLFAGPPQVGDEVLPFVPAGPDPDEDEREPSLRWRTTKASSPCTRTER